MPETRKQPLFRFAPSPTGYLHLGHAFSALFTWWHAARTGGTVLLRIEDIDPQRCKPQFDEAILEDLDWLGLRWPEPVRRQSAHQPLYQAALDRLAPFTYPCFCSRKEINAEIARSVHAPHGPEGPLYPGTCRALSPAERAARLAQGAPHAIRLDVAKAAAAAGRLHWQDVNQGSVAAEPGVLGDAILARKDVPMSYHLCVVVDDAAQRISEITRGDDLYHATHLHRLLQALLDLPSPRYRFHPLMRNAAGERLSKRDGAIALRDLRAAGERPEAIRSRLGFDRFP